MMMVGKIKHERHSMTTKERHQLNHAWQQLREINIAMLRHVTAGEFAKEFGVARNTARKLLERMLLEGAIMAYTDRAKNGVNATYYAVHDIDDIVFAIEENFGMDGIA